MRKLTRLSVMMVPLGVLVLWTAPLAGQAGEGMAPLPAEPPIGGPVWTIVIPAALFLGSFLGTYLLYRRFSKTESGG